MNSTYGNKYEHDMAMLTDLLHPHLTYVPWVTLNMVMRYNTNYLETILQIGLTATRKSPVLGVCIIRYNLTEHAYKGKGPDTCYSATYMSQTGDQQRFTISEVAADWHEPTCCSALCGHPLPTLTDNWTHGAASRHIIAPISQTRPSPRSRSYYSFPVPLRVGG